MLSSLIAERFSYGTLAELNYTVTLRRRTFFRSCIASKSGGLPEEPTCFLERTHLGRPRCGAISQPSFGPSFLRPVCLSAPPPSSRRQGPPATRPNPPPPPPPHT